MKEKDMPGWGGKSRSGRQKGRRQAKLQTQEENTDPQGLDRNM
jgi:hypothetical protein